MKKKLIIDSCRECPSSTKRKYKCHNRDTPWCEPDKIDKACELLDDNCQVSLDGCLDRKKVLEWLGKKIKWSHPVSVYSEIIRKINFGDFDLEGKS